MVIEVEIDDSDNDDDFEDNIGNRLEATEDTSDSPVLSESAHPYARLTPDVVVAAVESTGRFSDARILALNSYENRVYQVGIDDEDPVITKFYRPNRWSDEQILEEHRFTDYLYQQDIPVVPPLLIGEEGSDRTLSSYEGFQFAIYTRQGGRAPELDNLDHLNQLGEFIGRIHVAGKSFPFQHRVHLSSTDAHKNVGFLIEHQFIPHEIRAAYESVTIEILALIDQRKPEQDHYQQISLHGDCHRGNVLWRDDRPHFVDFDDAITGPAIQDLWMMLSGDSLNQQRQLIEIIDGYNMFADFDLAELNLIEPLRAMRVLHFNSWLAKRWDDPAFPLCFPWFNTERFWSEHILELKETLTALQEPSLRMPDYR
ncbi:MAG: Ser/Thr protein kinase RdoA (MazF antagonist) [Gammaproteobacteria bacterium]